MPEYAAVIEWVPTARLLVVQVAVDDGMGCGWGSVENTGATTGTSVQIALAPSVKVTVPAGVPETARVAVKGTLWPAVDGLSDEVTVTMGVTSGAVFTVCINAVEVAGL